MSGVVRWYSILAFACVTGAHAQDSSTAEARALQTGQSFSDTLGSGSQGPEMVVVPSGRFRMGCQSGSDCYVDETPLHDVIIPQPFAVSKYEVTFEDWHRCVAGGGCGGYAPDDGGWGRGRRPAINVSWDDAQTYVAWLSEQSGRTYRLLSEAEWEYVARAGSSSQYSWGSSIGTDRANCDGCGSRWDDRQTAPVGSFQANAFGLHDMHGNVIEWVEDCWNDSYVGAPTDGGAWETGNCSARVLRGGSWYSTLDSLRSAYRWRATPVSRDDILGFRVARTLAATDPTLVRDRLRDTDVPGTILHTGLPAAFLDAMVSFDSESAPFIELNTGAAPESSVREVIEDIDSHDAAKCVWVDIGISQFRADCSVQGVPGLLAAQLHFEWYPDLDAAELIVRARTASTTEVVPYIGIVMWLRPQDAGE